MVNPPSNSVNNLNEGDKENAASNANDEPGIANHVLQPASNKDPSGGPNIIGNLES